MVDNPSSTQPRLHSGLRLTHFTPVLVALTTLSGYLLVFFLFLNTFKDIRAFILVDRQFVTRSDKSPVIKPDPTFPYSKTGGYDGQFVYFIALDPAAARYYLDIPPYRYTRILYPLAARALALGRPEMVPYALVFVNLLAMTVGTWAVAAWCRLRGLSPWLALVYAFYVGQVLAFVRDLTEILAYVLVAVGVYLFDRSPRGFVWSAISFGLAGLTRETTLIFPVLYALFMLFGGTGDGQRVRPLRVLLFAVLSIGPAVAWQIYLISWLGKLGLGSGPGFSSLPFEGLYDRYPLRGDALVEIAPVIAPGVICLGASILYMVRSRATLRRVELWCLSLNALLFAVLLPTASTVEIYASGRIAVPVVLAAVFSLAWVPSRNWFYFCAGLWTTTSLFFVTNPLLQLLHGG